MLKAKLNHSKSEALEEAITELRKEETKKLNVLIPESTLRAFKKRAVDENKTMTDLILKWINRYISK